MSPTDITLIGDRILIQLDEHPEHTTLPSGLIVPQYVAGETDGNRPTSLLSDTKYLDTGTVLAVSPYAASRLEDLSTPLSPGDRVLLPLHATTPSYQFFLDRSKILRSFEGLICVPHTLLEAKVNETQN